MFTIKKSVGILSVLVLLGCDPIEHTNKPRVETRTMIIGGVPVHERDYALPDVQMSANEVYPSAHHSRK